MKKKVNNVKLKNKNWKYITIYWILPSRLAMIWLSSIVSNANKNETHILVLPHFLFLGDTKFYFMGNIRDVIFFITVINMTCDFKQNTYLNWSLISFLLCINYKIPSQQLWEILCLLSHYRLFSFIWSMMRLGVGFFCFVSLAYFILGGANKLNLNINCNKN